MKLQSKNPPQTYTVVNCFLSGHKSCLPSYTTAILTGKFPHPSFNPCTPPLAFSNTPKANLESCLEDLHGTPGLFVLLSCHPLLSQICSASAACAGLREHCRQDWGLGECIMLRSLDYIFSCVCDKLCNPFVYASISVCKMFGLSQ